MRAGILHWQARNKPGKALCGWFLAASLVAVALAGPPLTGQGIPTLIELRHDILTIDREFERLSIGADTSVAGTRAVALDGRAQTASVRPKIDGGPS